MREKSVLSQKKRNGALRGSSFFASSFLFFYLLRTNKIMHSEERRGGGGDYLVHQELYTVYLLFVNFLLAIYILTPKQRVTPTYVSYRF